MRSKFGNELVNIIKNELIKKAGYCGVSDGDNTAMLNSTDKEGNINISLEHNVFTNEKEKTMLKAKGAEFSENGALKIICIHR